MKHHTFLMGMGLLVAAVTATGCNTFIGADDPDVIEEGELQPGQSRDDLDKPGDGEDAATCGDGIVNHFLDDDDVLHYEECDDGNTDPDDGCDNDCQVTCGEKNGESGVNNELESADHHCYQFAQLDEGLGFGAAEGACQSWYPNAHLVVINSAEEFIDVQNGVMHYPGGGATAWLGAKRNDQGTFEWMVDGDVVETVAPDDKHWIEGEPRNPTEPEGEDPPEELCLTMDGSMLGYAAANCEDSYFYICELDRPGTVPEPPEDGGP